MQNTIHVINTMDTDVVDEFSMFPIGSISKVFTGILITILCNKGMLSLTDSVGKYIHKNELNNFENITVNNLIEYTGGMRYQMNTYMHQHLQLHSTYL
jgi:CubicO group peptidase (beta-lactamase class C family)